MVTAFLLRLAEISHWFSLVSVISGFLVTLVVLFRFFREDIFAPGGITRVGSEWASATAARMSVRRAPLPVAVILRSADEDGISVRLTSRPPWRLNSVRVRLFAGVSVAALHHVLRGPWQWFLHAFEHNGNPFGSEGCQQAGKVITVQMEGGEEEEGVAEVRLDRPEVGEALELGDPPRDRYPFVLASIT